MVGVVVAEDVIVVVLVDVNVLVTEVVSVVVCDVVAEVVLDEVAVVVSVVVGVVKWHDVNDPSKYESIAAFSLAASFPFVPHINVLTTGRNPSVPYVMESREYT